MSPCLTLHYYAFHLPLSLTLCTGHSLGCGLSFLQYLAPFIDGQVGTFAFFLLPFASHFTPCSVFPQPLLIYMRSKITWIHYLFSAYYLSWTDSANKFPKVLLLTLATLCPCYLNQLTPPTDINNSPFLSWFVLVWVWRATTAILRKTCLAQIITWTCPRPQLHFM